MSKPSAFTSTRPPSRPRTAVATFFGHRDFGRGQIGVVGDEHRAGADGDHARARVHLRLADVRAPSGVGADGVADALELSRPHLGQVLALLDPGGLAVEVDGDFQFLPDPGAEVHGELDGLRGGGVAERHEGHDIGRPHARVLTLMGREVDERRGDFHHGQHGFCERRSLSDEGHHAAIVVGVLLHVEHGDPGYVARRCDDAGDLRLVAALGEVGYTLEQAHAETSGK